MQHRSLRRGVPPSSLAFPVGLLLVLATIALLAVSPNLPSGASLGRPSVPISSVAPPAVTAPASTHLPLAVTSAQPGGQSALGGRGLEGTAPRSSPPTSGIEFWENGLPHGKTWNVTVGATTQEATGNVTYFAEGSGLYDYQVIAIPGYLTHWAGSVLVSDDLVNVSVNFSVNLYHVYFVYTGLPVQNWWTVTIGGLEWGSNSSIVVEEPNGTYPFTVGPVPDYTTPSWKGLAIVSGQPENIVVQFSLVTYSVTFVSAIPNGTSWSLLVGTQWVNGSGPLVFLLGNGTYPVSAVPVSGFIAPGLSWLVVNDSAEEVDVAYEPFVFPLTFSETGLAIGSSWSVVLDGRTYTTSGSSLALEEPNGTFHYLIEVPTGYQGPSAGDTTVEDGPGVVHLVFSRITVGVIFSETGLPSGTTWSFELNGENISVSGDQTELQLAPGNFTYEVFTTAGESPTPSAGSFQVVAAALLISVDFSSAAPTTSGSGSTTTTFGLALLVLLGLVFCVLLGLWVRLARGTRPRRGRESAVAPTAAEEEGPEEEKGSAPPGGRAKQPGGRAGRVGEGSEQEADGQRSDGNGTAHGLPSEPGGTEPADEEDQDPEAQDPSQAG